MKLQTALALVGACFAAAGSYPQSQPARSTQDKQTESQATKQQLRQVLERDP